KSSQNVLIIPSGSSGISFPSLYLTKGEVMRFKLHLIRLAWIVISPSAFAGINRWTSNGPQGGSVNALVVDPADDATVYATTNRGVYKSENSGTLWKPMTNGMSDLSVSALTISPEDHA